MERSRNDTKAEGKSSDDSRFDDLLQNFSKQIDKQVSKSGYQEKHEFSEQLILNTVFPKYFNQPLERYLCISSTLRLKAFFEALHPFDIVIGKVSSIIGDHIFVVLLCMVDGQRRCISDLGVMTTVIPDETLASRMSLEEDEFKVGDKVKGVVVHVDRASRKLEISFQQSHLGEDQIRHFPLGKLAAEDLEDENICDDNHNDSGCYSHPLSFIRDVERSSDFIDPHCIKRLLNKLKLPEQCLSFLGNRSSPIITESAEEMREKQSFKWSMDMVGAGVKHFREQRLKDAMKCFDQSISFYPKNVEAFVARGALKANKNELDSAVEDFRQGLQLNPEHKNAKKYIIETISCIAKRYEKSYKWKEASRCYKDILELDIDNKEASIRYNQINQILIPKILEMKSVQDTSPRKQNKPLSAKSKERINKLKKLLEAETKRKDYSSSSSTTSTSSDSDSSSDENWIERPTKIQSTEDRGKGKKRQKKSFSPANSKIT